MLQRGSLTRSPANPISAPFFTSVRRLCSCLHLSHTHKHTLSRTHFLPPYLCVIGACVVQLLHGQLMCLPEEQQLLVQEAHLLLGALAVAQLKDTRDKQ